MREDGGGAVSGRAGGWLVCGVAGLELDADERRLLAEVRPAGVVLFARNVDDPAQLASLVRELRRLPSAPYAAIDLEGGRVNRLERLIGPLPASAAAARAGPRAVRALARAAASACAHFGVGVDLAPVVDIARRGGFLAGEARCFGASALKVHSAAATFLAGLEAYGVAGCLKHYPGLGSGEVDSHRDLPELGEEVATDSQVFHRLAGPGRAVMVAHALAPRLGEGALPATLSRAVVGRLRSLAAPILADDLEMGALKAFGTIPQRAAAALAAGCDQVLVCNALAVRQEVAEHVGAVADGDPSLAAALREGERRVVPFGRAELRPVGWDQVRRLADRARRLAGGVP